MHGDARAHDREHRSSAAIATRSEILVIDDRSTDGSPEWLNARAAEGRLRVLSGHGRGLSAAINAGVRASRYPVICQIDQDVELLPGWVDRLTG